MVSYDYMTIHHSSSMQQQQQQDENNNDEDSHHHHPSHLSRLSMCISNTKPPLYDDNDDDEGDDGGDMYISRLSLEGSDADADEELSDCNGVSGVSSDSDKESAGCFSLPATPPRRRIRRRGSINLPIGVQGYGSENEAQNMRRNWRRRVVRERFWEKNKYREEVDEKTVMEQNNIQSGESECVVITRPKGGRRCLCMGLEEVKACRDLGFELKHERILEVPSRNSMSGSSIDTTSSGSNSPIANWRVSSPGDDPRDVKARLKVWAQAVALASASRLVS